MTTFSYHRTGAGGNNFASDRESPTTAGDFRASRIDGKNAEGGAS